MCEKNGSDIEIVDHFSPKKARPNAGRPHGSISRFRALLWARRMEKIENFLYSKIEREDGEDLEWPFEDFDKNEKKDFRAMVKHYVIDKGHLHKSVINRRNAQPVQGMYYRIYVFRYISYLFFIWNLLPIWNS